MPIKTYKGSCFCGRVKFEADIDFSQGTGKCNCTSCFKKRWWSVKVKPEHFRSLSGEQELSESKPGSQTGHRGFCKHCGVIPYGWVDAAEWNDGAYISVNVAALDNVEPGELIAAPVQYFDGKADKWERAPAETRHL